MTHTFTFGLWRCHRTLFVPPSDYGEWFSGILLSVSGFVIPLIYILTEWGVFMSVPQCIISEIPGTLSHWKHIQFWLRLTGNSNIVGTLLNMPYSYTDTYITLIFMGSNNVKLSWTCISFKLYIELFETIFGIPLEPQTVPASKFYTL